MNVGPMSIANPKSPLLAKPSDRPFGDPISLSEAALV